MNATNGYMYGDTLDLKRLPAYSIVWNSIVEQ